MLEFIIKHTKLDPFQYGFIRQSNVLSATSDLADYISSNLDRNRLVVLVLIDLQKAFDVVDHEILLKKLYCLSFRGMEHKLIQSYLCNRNR